MEAYEAARLFINKELVAEGPRRRGNPGYPRLVAVRTLVFYVLKGLENDTRLVAHLEKHPHIVGALGLNRIPHRTTIGRWWRGLQDPLLDAFEALSALIRVLAPIEVLVVDSTPLEDEGDSEARWGFYSKGFFRGFKVHVSVDQRGLPLHVEVTPGNRYDGPFLPRLIRGFTAEYVVGDAAYDSKANYRVVRRIGAEAAIAVNPRNAGRPRRTRHKEVLKGFRYLVEQLFSLLKGPLLNHGWGRVHGLAKKASLVYAALTALLIRALEALLKGEDRLLRKVSTYWG